MERQTKTKKSGEENGEQELYEEEDRPKTARELFPATPATYKTFDAKEHRKGKEPHWMLQQANVEERSTQAKTPQKEAASPSGATDLSKQLAEQIREAQETMAKMKETMENTPQPPFAQEMQQHILNLQQGNSTAQRRFEH